MLCVVIEHVCWIDLTSYQLDPRFTETVSSNRVYINKILRANFQSPCTLLIFADPTRA